MRLLFLSLVSLCGISACSAPKVSNAQKCTQTVLDYADLRDDPNKAEAYGALFSEDGTFTLGPNTATGRAAIIKRHESTNAAMQWNHIMDDIKVTDDLSGTSRVIVYTTPLGVETDVSRFIVADYIDKFEIARSGKCLIKSRSVNLIFDSNAE